MRLRLDSDTAVRIAGDYGGPAPIQGVTQTWFNSRDWDDASAKERRAIIRRVRKQEQTMEKP